MLTGQSVKVFMGQIPKTLVEEDLRRIFAQYGNIIDVQIIRDKVTGASKGTFHYYCNTRYQCVNRITFVFTAYV